MFRRNQPKNGIFRLFLRFLEQEIAHKPLRRAVYKNGLKMAIVSQKFTFSRDLFLKKCLSIRFEGNLVYTDATFRVNFRNKKAHVFAKHGLITTNFSFGGFQTINSIFPVSRQFFKLKIGGIFIMACLSFRLLSVFALSDQQIITSHLEGSWSCSINE